MIVCLVFINLLMIILINIFFLWFKAILVQMVSMSCYGLPLMRFISQMLYNQLNQDDHDTKALPTNQPTISLSQYSSAPQFCQIPVSVYYFHVYILFFRPSFDWTNFQVNTEILGKLDHSFSLRLPLHFDVSFCC